MFVFPTHIFNPDPIRAGVVGRVISGGTAINGEDTTIQTDGGGRWEITYGEFDLDDPYRQRLWTSWRSFLAGGSRAVLVPTYSLGTAHFPQQYGDFLWSDIVADDDYFPTSVGFVDPMIKARIAANAALRATTVEIEMLQGGALVGGETFGTGRRSYEIQRVVDRFGDVFTCTLGMPLRAPLIAGGDADFNWPVVQCKAVLGQSLIPDISLSAYGSISVSFAEDFSDAEE